MKIVGRGSVISLGVAALLVSSLSGGVGESAEAASTSGVVVHQMLQRQAAGSYWTDARMRAAEARDTVNVAGSEIRPSGAERVRTARTVPAQEPDARLAEAATLGVAIAETSVPHVGKVFFRLDGTDYTCSGNSIASSHGNLVSSAAHCMNAGPGPFVSEFIFVPGYDAYAKEPAPYGLWAAKTVVVPAAWVAGGEIDQDTGFAIVTSPADSVAATLSDVVGASGAAFHQVRGSAQTLYGYPAAAPFDGATIQRCDGKAIDDPTLQTSAQGVECAMTGGSSGGPWFVTADTGLVQNSVNSFKYDHDPGYMFGPYWGDAIEDVYNVAAATASNPN